MAEKLKELKRGKSRFRVVGKVSLGQNSFTEPKLNQKGNWLGLPNQNSAFGVNTTDDGNLIFLSISGGRLTSTDVIRVFPRNRDNDGGEFKFLEIKFDERFDEKKIEQVSFNNIYTAQINKEDGRKQFIDPIDFQEYLKENIRDGDDVVVVGNVDRSNGKPWDIDSRTFRNYEITGVYSNEARERKNEDGEVEMVQNEPEAYITQTYLLTSDSVPSDYKKQLKDNGEVVLSTFVPQYIGNAQDSKGKYTVEYKKVVGLPEALVFKGKEAIVDKFFKVPDDDTVREVEVYADVVEGFEVSKGNIELTPELQWLIDEGDITEEEIAEDVSVKGPRRSDTVYRRFSIRQDEEGNKYVVNDNKYAFEALAIPSPEVEEIEFDPTSTKGVFDEMDADKDVSVMGDDDFLDMFE